MGFREISRVIAIWPQMKCGVCSVVSQVADLLIGPVVGCSHTHVAISYNWTSQPCLVQVKFRLQASASCVQWHRAGHDPVFVRTTYTAKIALLESCVLHKWLFCVIIITFLFKCYIYVQLACHFSLLSYCPLPSDSWAM